MSDHPGAMAVEKGISVYDGRVSPAIGPERARIIGEGSGVFVVKRAAGIAASDHFAKAGASDRIWNSLQKRCVRTPGSMPATVPTR